MIKTQLLLSRMHLSGTKPPIFPYIIPILPFLTPILPYITLYYPILPYIALYYPSLHFPYPILRHLIVKIMQMQELFSLLIGFPVEFLFIN